MAEHSFPPDFLFGAATAAYQIEGAVGEDGRGDSIWDVFCRQPGRIKDDQDATVACDHYRRWREDLALMRELGLTAYRFSISWPRILPDGEGTVNEAGLAHYEQFVDALLEAGITPYPTLCHWDLPQALESRYGGWRSKEVSRRFADYAGLVVGRLSDRVTTWATLNEIDNMTRRAYHRGASAPGLTLSRQVGAQTTHNAVLAHGLGVLAARAAAKRPVAMGLVEDPEVFWPVWESDEHVAATWMAYEASWFNRAKLLPIIEGRYRDEHLAAEGADAPEFTDDEMRIIGTPLDWLGLNCYRGQPVRAVPGGLGFNTMPIPAFDTGVTQISFTPLALYWMLRWVHRLAPELPLAITENGLGCSEGITTDGEVLDVNRKEVLRLNLECCARALAEHIPLRGYFAWSLLDNFEWGSGYSVRFGLVRVNYATQQRTVKLSGNYYREVIRARRVL